MLTPAYSSTATERVLPRLALDFTTGALDPRVTITRALNTATRVNSSGLVEIINANLPRFDYDPVTLAPKGLLIEEARTNSVTYSEDFSNVIWSLTGATISADAAVSPSGASNADQLVEDTSTGQHRTFQAFSATSGVAYTFTVYVKQAGRTLVKLTSATGVVFEATYDINAGTVTNTVSGTASIRAAGNGWYRLVISATASATQSTNLQIRLVDSGTNTSYTGDGTSGIYVWGAQVEAGAFATSYIPTTATSLTRNADAVSMTGANFSDWYNASEGAFSVSYVASNATKNQNALFASNGTATERMGIRGINSSSQTIVIGVAGGATQWNAALNGQTVNALTNACWSYKVDSVAWARGGANAGADTLAVIPTVNQLRIGADETGVNLLNGHVQKINYWPQRITNAETTAFSK